MDLGTSDKPIPIQKAVNKVGDPEKRSTTVSNIFTLPWSERNRRIFGFLDNPSISVYQPYRKLKAKLLQNGREIIPNGICEIQGTSDQGISTMIYDSIVDLFEYLNSKKLSDLDLRFYNHTYTIDNIRQSQANTSGYKYPVIGYSELPSANENGYRYLSYKLFRPAFFVKTLFKEILVQAGYTFDFPFFNERRFNTELIPFTNKVFKKPLDYDFSFESVDVELFPDEFYRRTTDANSAKFIVAMYNVISDPGNHWNDLEYTSTAEISVRATFKFTLSMLSTFLSDGSGRVYLAVMWEVLRQGTTDWISIQAEEFRNTQENLREEFKDRQCVADVELREGDKLRVSIETHILNPIGNYMDLWVSPGARATINAEDGGLQYGEVVSIAANLPDMTQKDFIKDVWQRYCCTPIEDSTKKHIYFKHFSELFRNKKNAIDWSTKFTTDHEPEVDFKLSDKYGQMSYFRYKEVDTVDNNLGIGSISITNELLPPELTVITSMFSATSSIVLGGGLLMADIKMVSDPDHEQEKYDFSEDTTPRLLLDRTVQENNILLKRGDTLESTDNAGPMSFPLFSIENGPSLSFSELIKEYFIELEIMLTDTRVEKRYALLNENDLVDLDFFIPIYDKKSSQYYYLNQIQNYIEGEPCKVELVKM